MQSAPQVRPTKANNVTDVARHGSTYLLGSWLTCMREPRPGQVSRRLAGHRLTSNLSQKRPAAVPAEHHRQSQRLPVLQDQAFYGGCSSGRQRGGLRFPASNPMTNSEPPSA